MTSASPLPAAAPLALVAGASRGLGLAIARDLGRRGHRLGIWARSATELKQAASSLHREGITVRTVGCDVTDPAAVETMVQSVERGEGPIEVALAVAGVIQV